MSDPPSSCGQSISWTRVTMQSRPSLVPYSTTMGMSTLHEPCVVKPSAHLANGVCAGIGDVRSPFWMRPTFKAA